MSASNTVRVSASPAQVRAWAEAEGLIGKGQRGRLGATVIKAYNAKHGVKHTESKFVPTVKHTVKPPKGRKIERTLVIKDVRAAAKAAGVEVGPQGTLSKAVLDAYVLGSLSSLAKG
jgi:hypothetical protein